MERTLVLIKPEGLHRGQVGCFIARFEQKGYKLLALKLMQPSRELLQQHYAHLVERSYYCKLLDYMSSGPVVAMVWAGCNVVSFARQLLDDRNPQTGGRLLHGSQSLELAQQEIALWFAKTN